MKTNTETPSEFQKFDATVGKLLSVSHKELQKREKKYQRQRARLKKKKAG
ncbi:MAG: hypothetical protein ACHQIK_17290 [Candidatus Acidiferrales bacterium]